MSKENWKELCFAVLAAEMGWKEGWSDIVEGKLT